MLFAGLLVAQGSGSAGGVTASHNKGGFYLKTRPVPTNPNSARQQATRTLLGSYASRWTLLLTQGQRDQWNTYAQTNTIKNALGQDIYINGINWYIMFGTRLSDAGFAGILVPPVGAVPIGFDTMTIDISALNTADVTFTPPLAAGNGIQLWQSLPVTAGSTPNRNQQRLVGYSAADQVTPWAATLPFGILSGAQASFFAYIMNTDGQLSVASTHVDLADY